MAGEPHWRVFVDAVLYMVQFEPTLDDEQVVAGRAGQLVAQPIYDRPVDDTVDALRTGLASGEQLTGQIPQPHEEATVRAFLGRLVDQLEALRPWPTQPYRKLPVDSHADVLDGRVVARSATTGSKCPTSCTASHSGPATGPCWCCSWKPGMSSRSSMIGTSPRLAGTGTGGRRWCPAVPGRPST